MKRVILLASFFLLFLVGLAQAQAASLTVTFTDNAINETGTEVERCQGAGCSSFARVATLGVNVTTHVDTLMPEGVTFCYRVRAVNTAGASAYSNIACAATLVSLPAAPSNLLVK